MAKRCQIGIHQSDCVATSAGVARLPLYLSSSKQLCCLFDAQWTTRLWCVFELAVLKIKIFNILVICLQNSIQNHVFQTKIQFFLQAFELPKICFRFLKMRRVPNVKFISISQRSVEVILVVLGTLLSDTDKIVKSTIC